MAYVLENEEEFERLERQSSLPAYDPQTELADLDIRPGMTVLDAGCGSGVVTRFLSKRYPKTRFIGCDASIDRVKMAKHAALNIPNVEIESQNLLSLNFKDASFDLIICRYTLQHIAPSQLLDQAIAQLYRVLKPGGVLRIVETDGLFINLFPQPKLVKEVLDAFKNGGPVDFAIGRKVSSHLARAGFLAVERRVEIIDCQNECLIAETKLMEQRLEATKTLLKEVLQSEAKAEEFKEQYLETMNAPGSVYFFNKFIVTGNKAKSRKLRIVK